MTNGAAAVESATRSGGGSTWRPGGTFAAKIDAVLGQEPLLARGQPEHGNVPDSTSRARASSRCSRSACGTRDVDCRCRRGTRSSCRTWRRRRPGPERGHAAGGARSAACRPARPCISSASRTAVRWR